MYSSSKISLKFIHNFLDILHMHTHAHTHIHTYTHTLTYRQLQKHDLFTGVKYL